MRPTLVGLATTLVLSLTGMASAQTTVAPAPVGPATTGTVAPSPGTTGNAPNVTIAPSGTGADTIQTDSAVGGNAGQPSRAVPQGGSNSGTGNSQ